MNKLAPILAAVALLSAVPCAAATNTAGGNGAGQDISSGTDNTLLGYDAGSSVSSGGYNVILGEGGNITTGSSNILIGNDLTATTASSSHQIDVGDVIIVTGAGTPSTSTTTIEGNLTADATATALNFTTSANSGSYQLNGTNALYYPDSDTTSLAVGNALATQSSISLNNVAMGYEAGQNITTGASNVAIGFGAMEGVSSTPLTSDKDTAIGYLALANVQGSNAGANVAVGFEAAEYVTISNGQVAIGDVAMTGVSATPLTGSQNTAIGVNSGTGLQGSANGNTFVGGSSGVYNSTGSQNTGIGQAAMNGASASPITGDANTALGVGALQWIEGSTGSNTALGESAMEGTSAVPITGSNNTSTGQGALEYLSNGSANTALGYQAMQGVSATPFNSSGGGNTAVGSGAGQFAEGAISQLTAVGWNAALYDSTGNFNTAIGTGAMQGVSSTPLTGCCNTVLGVSAGHVLQGAAENNVIIGNNSADTGTDNLTTGSKNTYVGTNTQPSSATVTNENVFGYTAVGEGTNTITLGNTSITALYCEKTSITGISDARDKKDIEPTDLGLDFILKLRPVSYRLTNGGEALNYGFTAQDTESALPQRLQKLIEQPDPNHGLAMVVHDQHDVYHMAYGDLEAPIVKAIQEQQHIIQQQQKEIDGLKAELKLSVPQNPH